MNTDVDRLLRELTPEAIGALTRRYQDFGACEDAVQEALLEAAVQWPRQGIPGNPRGWLIRVADRRMADRLRGDSSRRRREATVAALTPPGDRVSPAPDRDAEGDDSLALLLMCCHPALTPASQVALTLRAVGGLTTTQIARAFLVPETTMGRRISRAKRDIKAAGARFGLPAEPERTERLRAVLHVLYLIFNEGYTATSGSALVRGELTGEAIRVARQVHRLLPDDGEAAGLLALMLLTDARRPGRTGPDGALIPLAEQDRSTWDSELILEGTALITDALPRARIGPYQLQAAIAAVHAQARTAEQTDWAQILALYDVLVRITPNPMFMLSHVVAVAMVHGPQAGLDKLDRAATDKSLVRHHRHEAVRAHLLEMLGDHHAARTCYAAAARKTSSLPEKRYLHHRAQQLHGDDIA